MQVKLKLQCSALGPDVVALSKDVFNTHFAHTIHSHSQHSLTRFPRPFPVPRKHTHTHTSSSKRRETRTKCATSSATPALCPVAPLGPPSLLSSPSPSVCCAHDNKRSVRVTLTPTRKKITLPLLRKVTIHPGGLLDAHLACRVRLGDVCARCSNCSGCRCPRSRWLSSSRARTAAARA